MRTGHIKNIGLLLLCFSTVSGAFSQSLPDSVISKIDNLFAKWNSEVSPGCTIGIVRNDSLIYAKGYGMANLEHGIPNTAETISYIASASKPFTAYSIILLARQGKINFNDDIHKYLPWFPDVNEKITISHLLKNTSGIRDLWQLLAISGTRLDDVVRTNHVLKLLGKQQTLNFKPGSYHNSSTSDFTLLAEVVKSITGQSLRSFTDSAIFNPLRMYTTHFYDNYRETIKNRASSYVRTDSIHFETRIVNYSNVGETGVQTNINDMSKWVMNFYEPKLGDLEDIDQLTMKIKLDNGKEPPAEGMPPDSYKGWRQFWYIGGFAGYRSFVTVIPKLKIGFIVFSNVDDLDPVAKVYEIADLFIKENMQKGVVQNPEKDTSAATLRDPLAIRKFLGDYISENGVQTSFQIEKGKLFSHVGNLTWLWVDEGGNNFYDKGERYNGHFHRARFC